MFENFRTWKDNPRLFGLIVLVLSLFILYPHNIREIFYYDDNPIRYMVAKIFCEKILGKARFSDYEIRSLMSYGSAEIYIPFILLSEILGYEQTEMIYNIVSLSSFVLGLLFLIIKLPPEKKIFIYVIPVLSILGIICVVRGSIHWFISSIIFTYIIFEKKNGILSYLLMTIAYIISPQIIVVVLIYSVSIILQRKEKDDMRRNTELGNLKVFTVSLLLSATKFLLGGATIYNDIKSTLTLDISEIQNSMDVKTFLPLSFDIFIRFVKVDYFDFSFLLSPIPYVSAIIGFISTRSKTITLLIILFTLFLGISFVLFKLWLSYPTLPFFSLSFSDIIPIDGFEKLPIIIVPGILLLIINPLRFFPLLIILLIKFSKKVNGFDEKIKFLFLSLFFIRAIISLMGYSPLPKSIPEEIKNLIKTLEEKTVKGDRILIEADKHIFKNGRLIHPIYDSHIMSYVVAKIERKFFGGIIPWETSFSNFIAGKFKSKELEESNIIEYIQKEKIKYVICWTEKCKKFFSDKSEKIFTGEKISVFGINF